MAMGSELPKIDRRITKVNYVGYVGEGGFDDHEKIVIGSLIMIKTITDNRMVSMKYLAAAICLMIFR